MPRKTVPPIVSYRCIEEPDNKALDTVFDYLFSKFFEEKH